MEKHDIDRILRAYCKYAVNTTSDVKWYELVFPILMGVIVIGGLAYILKSGI